MGLEAPLAFQVCQQATERVALAVQDFQDMSAVVPDRTRVLCRAGLACRLAEHKPEAVMTAAILLFVRGAAESFSALVLAGSASG